MRRLGVLAFCVSFLFVAALLPRPAAAASCESLVTLSLADTTIVSTTFVPAGDFTPPAAAGSANTAAQAIRVPAFCRVVGRVRPAITFEVWMPVAGWNGKFQGVGGGGFAGVISYPAMGTALNRGYATASTDTGHVGGNGNFALGHPELVVDFGHRAIHEMTVKAKAIVNAFYDSGPTHSYFVGCSTGGRQGLMEAQRYPNDYDGIIAGAAAASHPHLHAAQLWVAGATLKDSGSFIPPSKYPLINKAVLAACDARDGVTDGVLEDPRRCDFDLKTLQCSGGDADTCLTVAQVEAAQRIYTPVRNPRTGREIFPALPAGSELGWATQAGGPAPMRLATEFFRYFVFEDPNWDWRTFDFDHDVDRAEAKIGPIVTAMNPNLKEFSARGGKLVMYHGWDDQQIAAGNSLNYYNSVVSVLGEQQTDQFLRLFMVPGMQHCRGGPGPNSFDAVGALETWVELGKPPQQIIASRSTNDVVDRTRPLCPYPQVAVYKGTGSTDDASNFECRTPRQPTR